MRARREHAVGPVTRRQRRSLAQPCAGRDAVPQVRDCTIGPIGLERPGTADEMSEAFLIPMAVATGVVVIVVAIAVVLVALVVAVSMRGRQKRGATRRAGNRQQLAEADERRA